jgi:2-isopropylmalate synthase
MLKIDILDTTLRDGVQSPGCGLFVDEKFELAKKLDSMGVNIIEAGFPISSFAEYESVKQISDYFHKRGPTICAFARLNKLDIDQSWLAVKNAKKKRIHLGIGSSDIHMKSKLNLSKNQVLEKTKNIVNYACLFDWQVQFYAEDSTRSNVEFLIELVSIAESAGATIINLPDTTGICSNNKYFELIQNIKNNLSKPNSTILSTHCHDDLGLATSNTLNGILAGAQQIECTLGGIGERCGNASLEEVLANLNHNDSFNQNFCHNVDSSKIFATAQYLFSSINKELPLNKSIIGLNAFSTEAGIHADGNFKNSKNYLAIPPEYYGRSEETILGARSGKATLKKELSEIGFKYNPDELEKVYSFFLKKADLLLKTRGIEKKTLKEILEDYISNKDD